MPRKPRESVSSIAAAVLRNMGRNCLMDEWGVIARIAALAGITCNSHDPRHIRRRVLDDIEHDNQGQLVKRYLDRRAGPPTRVYWLPEHDPGD